MSKRILVKKHDDSKLPAIITPELAQTYIRIYGDDYATTGRAYFEGTIRIFIFERRPRQDLIEMFGKLKDQSSYQYRLNQELITVEKIDDPKSLTGRYSYISK